MKKLTLLLTIALLSLAVSAQQPQAFSHKSLHKPISKEMLGTKRAPLGGNRVDFQVPARAQAPRVNAELVTPPSDLDAESYRLNSYVFDGSTWEIVSNPVKVGVDGDDFYIQGFSLLLPEAWIKGTLNVDDMTVSFPMQYYGTFNGYDDYFFPVTPAQGGYAPVDAVFNYNPSLGTLVLSQDVVCYIFENSSDSELAWFYQFDSQMTIVPEGDVVEVPADLETQDYALSGAYMGIDATGWYEGDPLMSNAKVGFDGDDIYVQGMCVYLPLAWVKGHREGDTYVFDNGQYFGTFIYQGDAYPLYFMGCSANDLNPEPLVMTIDESTGVLTAQQWYAISASDEDIDWYDVHGNVKLSPIEDIAATPATPHFRYYEYYTDDDFGFIMLEIATTDVDGNPILTDKLGYQIFVDYGNGAEPYTFLADYYGFDEDWTTIPYNFGDDINFLAHGELAVLYGLGEGVQQVGVRAVYSGGGETHYSDIDWYNVYENEKVEITPPEGMEANTYTLTATDLQFGADYPEAHSADVLVGFDGSDVYIQGLSKWLPEAWVKGSFMRDGTVTFPKHFLGNFTAWGIDMEIVFNGATMAYDSETDTFTSAEGYTSTSGYDLEGEHYEEDADVMVDVVITRAADVAAVPAAPEILSFALNEGYGYMLEMNIPLEDIDGNPLFASKLSYQLFSMQDGAASPITLEASRYEYATEDLTIIPYLYTDYWEVLQGGETVYVHADGIENWDAIGAKSIYTGGGETHESDITWFEINTSSVTSISVDDAQSLQLYDLMGRRVDSSHLRPGIYVSQGRKVVVK